MNKPATPPAAWRALLSSSRPSETGTAWELIEDFQHIEQDRTDLGASAGPRHRDEPGFRWLPYKEAFSPKLVRAILDGWTDIDGPLLDPFSGSGTSLLVGLQRGLDGLGIEMLPYSRWAADTVLRSHLAEADDLQRIAGNAARSVAMSDEFGGAAPYPVPAASWALSDEVTATLSMLSQCLPGRGTSIEADLAHLALLSVVESVSTAVKDGTSLRHRERQRSGRTTRPGRKGQLLRPDQVIAAFELAASAIVDDLPKMPSGVARVVLGDARHLPVGTGSIGASIFSPPYPNRYDYSAVYQLELAVGGFVSASDDLRRIRKSLLRSHLEAPPAEALILDDPSVIAVLRSVDAAASLSDISERGRTMRMLVGYFDDMQRMLSELARVLRPGAPAACVVATQTYFGLPVPTDAMLASLAIRVGLDVEELWVLRRKRVAVQQRNRGLAQSSGGRESVVVLRRPLNATKRTVSL